MKMTVEIGLATIRQVMADYVNNKFGTDFSPEELPMTVRSKQNYRVHDWELGEARILIEVER